MKIRAWACTGSHGKPFYTSISQDLEKQGQFHIYQSKKEAELNSLYAVIPVTIITKSKKKSIKQEGGEGKTNE